MQTRALFPFGVTQDASGPSANTVKGSDQACKEDKGISTKTTLKLRGPIEAV